MSGRCSRLPFRGWRSRRRRAAMPHRTEKRRLRAAGNTGCLRPVHADARSANVVVVVMAAVCIRAIAVDAFAIADLVAAVCRLLVNAIVMGAARMIQRISQRYGRRSRGPSGKWCNKAASASVLKAYCVRFRRTAPTHCGPQLQATLTAVAFEIVVPWRHVTVPLRTNSIPPCACTRHWSGAAAAARRRAPARRRCRARANGGASLRWSMRTTCHACLR